jgi:hypothetical protein
MAADKAEEKKNKYDNGKIYKLCSDVDNKFYIGSTTSALCKRLYQHKSATSDRKACVYRHFNEIGKENMKIVLVESHACANKDELCRRERHWIESLKPELNKRIPTQTPEEYREKNKVRILAYVKKYYVEHKDKISARQNAKHDCPCGGKYTNQGKSQHVKSKMHKDWVEEQEEKNGEE